MRHASVMTSDPLSRSTRSSAGLRSRQLKLVRAGMGWKQSQLLLRLEDAGRRLGVQVAPRPSLKTMVSRWENGAPMSEDYRRLFCDVYGMADEDLGFPAGKEPLAVPAEPISDEIEAWELADAMTRSSITPTALAVMERTVFGYAASYPASPPSELLPRVRQQMRRLRLAIDGPQPTDVRRRSIALLGVLAGIAGNLSFDVGRYDQADAMFDVGRLAGTESGDADLAAWILATQSIGLFYAGRYAVAVQQLAEADRWAADASSPRRRAWITSLHARALAATGQPGPAKSLLSTATAEPTGTDFFDQARLDGFAGTCHLLLRDTAGAAKLLDQAIRRRAGTDAKGRALLTLDLAACRVIDREPEEAARLTGVALDIARAALVRPILDRARAVCGDMASWADVPAVADLDTRLAALTS
jgi:transcriptional regulator with XRE-family HTH domain